MQKRYDNKNQKKIHPLLPDFSAISAISAISATFPPKHDPPCEGLYNSRRRWNETPGASQALTAAHHLNHVNHSSDITQTLANARKLSSNTHTRKPVPHNQDKRSTINEVRASAPKAFMRSKTWPFCTERLSTSFADRNALKPASLPDVTEPVAKLTISGEYTPNKMRLPCFDH